MTPIASRLSPIAPSPSPRRGSGGRPDHRAPVLKFDASERKQFGDAFEIVVAAGAIEGISRRIGSGIFDEHCLVERFLCRPNKTRTDAVT